MKTIFRIASIALALCLSVHACWFTENNFNLFYIYGINSNAVHYDPRDWAGLNYIRYYNGMSVSLPITPFVKIAGRFPDMEGDYENDVQRDVTVKIAMLRCRVFRYSYWENAGEHGYRWVPRTNWKVIGYYVKKSYYQSHIENGSVANLDMMPDKYNPSSGVCEAFPIPIDFEMEYDLPMALFGTDILTASNVGTTLQNGDAIIFEYYLSDGLYESGDLEHEDEEVTPDTVLDVEGVGNLDEFEENKFMGDRSTFTPPFVFLVKYKSGDKILNPVEDIPVWRRQ